MKMKIEDLPILANNEMKPGVYKMTLGLLSQWDMKPGQFVDVKVPGKTLRRPISICDFNDKELTLVYKVVGEGTQWLSEIQSGQLEILGSLGNGFDLNTESNEVLLVGGGLGCAPMIAAAKALKKMKKKVHVIFGFRTPKDALFEDELKEIGVDYHYAYDCYGENAVTKMKALGLTNVPYMSCGPLPMMKALTEASSAKGQLSLEARMGCGFGACMGCSIRLSTGMARVCKDGPVFRSEEVVWENLK